MRYLLTAEHGQDERQAEALAQLTDAIAVIGGQDVGDTITALSQYWLLGVVSGFRSTRPVHRTKNPCFAPERSS